MRDLRGGFMFRVETSFAFGGWVRALSVCVLLEGEFRDKGREEMREQIDQKKEQVHYFVHNSKRFILSLAKSS
jgi:hypothetical protein